MSSKALYQLSGIALTIGGVLAAVCFLLIPGGNNPSKYLTPLWFPLNLLLIIGAILVTLGLPGMFARQAKQVGVLGLIGFILIACVVLIFNVASSTVDTFIYPLFAGHAGSSNLFSAGPPPAFGMFQLVGVLFELVGPVLLGIAIIRARVFPRWFGGLLIAASVLALGSFFLPLPIPLDAVVLYLSLASFGFVLLRRQASATEVQTPLVAHTAEAHV